MLNKKEEKQRHLLARLTIFCVMTHLLFLCHVIFILLCGALLKHYEQTHKRPSPMDYYSRTHQCWPTTKKLTFHINTGCLLEVLARVMAERGGWGGGGKDRLIDREREREREREKERERERVKEIDVISIPWWWVRGTWYFSGKNKLVSGQARVLWIPLGMGFEILFEVLVSGQTELWRSPWNGVENFGGLVGGLSFRIK